MAIKTVNTTSGEVVKTFGEFTDEKIEQIIEGAHSSFLKWKETPFSFRKNLMLNAAKELKSNKEQDGEQREFDCSVPDIASASRGDCYAKNQRQ